MARSASKRSSSRRSTATTSSTLMMTMTMSSSRREKPRWRLIATAHLAPLPPRATLARSHIGRNTPSARISTSTPMHDEQDRLDLGGQVLELDARPRARTCRRPPASGRRARRFPRRRRSSAAPPGVNTPAADRGAQDAFAALDAVAHLLDARLEVGVVDHAAPRPSAPARSARRSCRRARSCARSAPASPCG